MPQPKRLDRGLLVVLLLTIVAVWPFLSRPDLPQETDAELHIFRLAELTYLVEAGELYPRWAPHFYYGYGYPIFNYYAPLTYYLGLAVDLLPGMDAVDGVKAVFVLGLVAGAIGIYGFVRDNWGRPAGYIAAAVYTYAPYIQYVDPHARGALAEAFSFGVFPLALWALDRLRREPTAGRFTAASLLVAAIILTHNLMAMVFFGLLVGWAVWGVLGRWRGRPLAGPGRLATLGVWPFPALILGVVLSAFFWLPLALERDAVNLNTLVGQGDNFDFHTHFLSLSTLLGPSRWLDWGATEPEFVFNFGLAQWLLGGLGLGALLSRRARRAGDGAFFAIALVLLIFLMLPISAFLWESVPLLPFLQFPWRLLGASVAMLAVLSGIGTEAILSRRPAATAWAIPGGIGLVLLLALPVSQVPPWPPDFGPVNTQQLMEIELQGRWLGTTSTADFVPATVEVLPEPVGPLLDDLRHGRSLDPVNRASLPDTTSVLTVPLSPLRHRFEVSGDKDFLLRLFIFHFPGWTATVNGRPVPIELGRPEGFIVVPVPAGDHTVEVAFEETAARRLGWWVSALGVIAVGMVAFQLRSRPRIDMASDRVTPFLGALDWRVVTVVAALTLVHLSVLEPSGLLHYHSTGFVAEPADVTRYTNLGDQIALIGYDPPGSVVRPGETVELVLYWKAQESLTINYQVFVHLQAADGTVVAQSDKLNPGEYPTRRWPTDRYVRDVHELMLPPDLSPGIYTLSTGLWVQNEGWRLPVLANDGRQIGDHIQLMTLEVAGP